MADTKLDPKLVAHFREVYKPQSNGELMWGSENQGNLCPEAIQALDEVMHERNIVMPTPRSEDQVSTEPSAKVQPWVVNLRWQVVILAATVFQPTVFIRGAWDSTIGWFFDLAIAYVFNSAIAAGIAGALLLFFTASQKGKFARNQRIAVFVVMTALMWNGYILNAHRY